MIDAVSRRRKKIALRKRRIKAEKKKQVELAKQLHTYQAAKEQQLVLAERFTGNQQKSYLDHSSSPFHIELTPGDLELTSQKDGLFRGLVEPVVVCGIFSLDIDPQGALGNVKFLSRYHFRYSVREKSPTIASCMDNGLDFSTPRYMRNTALILVFAACEENNGKGVIELLDSLDDPSNLLVCDKNTHVSVPDALESIVVDNEENTPSHIDLYTDGQNAEKLFKSDSLIACSGLWFIPRVGFNTQIIASFKEENKTNRWQGSWTCQLIDKP